MADDLLAVEELLQNVTIYMYSTCKYVYMYILHRIHHHNYSHAYMYTYMCPYAFNVPNLLS